MLKKNKRIAYSNWKIENNKKDEVETATALWDIDSDFKDLTKYSNIKRGNQC